MKRIFLATGNKKKVVELKEILDKAGLDIEVLSVLDGINIPDVVEDGTTFEENSVKKALEIAKYLDMVAISDDSGLCVEALDGAPGIYSARYSGEDATDITNNKKLIKDLKGKKNRKAKFVCVITLAKPTGEVYSFRGEVEGDIIDEPRGVKGFGYDPHFFMKEYRKSLAEIPEKKKEISHRAVALKKLLAEIQNILD
ncbi:MAG: XTP/dITP diphosphatase [Fusobacteriaceae bacterium]